MAKTAKKDAINPSHYQGFFAGPGMETLQWLETKQYEQRFRDPKAFQCALELQIAKYMDRLGGKDDEVQELGKAHWYMCFLLAWKKNGCQPIRVKDIPKLLALK